MNNTFHSIIYKVLSQLTSIFVLLQNVKKPEVKRRFRDKTLAKNRLIILSTTIINVSHYFSDSNKEYLQEEKHGPKFCITNDSGFHSIFHGISRSK